MADTGKDEAGDATLVRLEQTKFAVNEGNDHVRLVNFDAVIGGDGIDRLGVDAERVERSEDIVWRVGGQKRQRQ